MAARGVPDAPDLARGTPRLSLANLPTVARDPFERGRPTVVQGAASALLGCPEVDVRCLPSLFRACLVQADINPRVDTIVVTTTKHHGYETYMHLPREVPRYHTWRRCGSTKCRELADTDAGGGCGV